MSDSREAPYHAAAGDLGVGIGVAGDQTLIGAGGVGEAQSLMGGRTVQGVARAGMIPPIGDVGLTHVHEMLPVGIELIVLGIAFHIGKAEGIA